MIPVPKELLEAQDEIQKLIKQSNLLKNFYKGTAIADAFFFGFDFARHEWFPAVVCGVFMLVMWYLYEDILQDLKRLRTLHSLGEEIIRELGRT